MRFYLLLLSVLICTNSLSWAKHIVGGYVSVGLVNKSTNEYRINLQLIYDENLGSNSDKAYVSIFRKKDNTRITDFTLVEQSQKALDYANAGCVVTAPDAKLIQVLYAVNVILSPSSYNDRQGYYLAWEECCRNSNTINIQNPNKAGMAFYTEIPPATILNSSPVYKDVATKYACIGKSIEIDFGATDPDGDQLQYTITTPLMGFTQGSGVFPTKPNEGPYPAIKWAIGYDSTQCIKGSMPPRIDNQGKITINASQLGQYAIAVRCEEWRSGLKIGEVRKEFMLVVVDCKNTVIPTPIIELKQANNTIQTITQPNGHISIIKFCSNDSVVVKAEDESPKWQYQWQFEGKNIEGANKISLPITKTGKYTLIKTQIDGCSTADSSLSSTDAVVNKAPNIKIISTKGATICQGDSTALSISPNLQGTFRWVLNNKSVVSTASINSGIKAAGIYKVFFTDNITGCTSQDSLELKTASKPVVQITSSGGLVFCSKDSTKLQTTKNSQYEYIWYKENIPIVKGTTATIQPTQTGIYYVEVTDTITKCKNASTPLQVIVRKTPEIVFDSVPPLCGTGIQATFLQATPKGGIFSGRGVIGTRFVSQSLSAGTYAVTYTYTSAEGCKATASRDVIIQPPPRVVVPQELTILKGEKVAIKTVIPTQATIVWFPTDGISDITTPNPTVSPAETTIYYATITTPEGCVVEKQTTIVVINLTIPNGFTPNTDGVNDVWEIDGIKDYPNCTVQVFDRWGNIIFSSKGYDSQWDGTWQGKEVPTGTYYYQIYIRNLNYRLSGSLNVFR